MTGAATIHNGGVLEYCATFDAEPFHACLCDPPYALQFMGKHWDGDVAFQPETWAAIASVLHPGALVFACAGTRGYHRQAVAMEDAGLIMHPSIFWMFGQGFPKATRIDTQIDRNAPRRHLFDSFAKHYAKQRKAKKFTHNQICEVGKFYAEHNHGGASSNWEKGCNVPTLAQWSILKPLLDLSEEFTPLIERIEAERRIVGKHESEFVYAPGEGREIGLGSHITEPATDLAKAWAGHRYGLQAMKPAAEVILVFQKPYQGKPAECIGRTGAGAFNVDAGRVGRKQSDRFDYGVSGDEPSQPVMNCYGEYSRTAYAPDNAGRWPSNVIIEDSVAPVLDAQSGQSVSNIRQSEDRDIPGATYALGRHGMTTRGHADSGGSSRFYFNTDWNAEEVDPFFYCGKAGRGERDAGLDRMPQTSKAVQYGDGLNSATKVRTVEQAEMGVDRGLCRNPHPTVKPLRLTRYLASLLLPPDAYAPRRLFVPFAGSGSECIGGILAGFEQVTGVEREQEYAEIARARLAFWQGHSGLFEALTAEEETEPEQFVMEM